jgi:hypothetical protein
LGVRVRVRAASVPPSVPGEPARRGALIALDSKCVSCTYSGAGAG